ncbi:MAG: hypothetical protein QOF35_1164 [Actinomycetota bacterium]|nr:hypothetical protein [Actinomycetota bacterium]
MKWFRFPRILGVIVCLYLVGMAVLFGFLSTESYRFVSNATATRGTVISLEVRRPLGSQREPNLKSPNVPLAPKVQYVVAGKTYTYVAAHGRYHQRLVVGDSVTVLYDPSNPARARLRGEGRILVPLLTSTFATLALVLGVVLYLTRDGVPKRRRPSQRVATDAREGEPVP